MNNSDIISVNPGQNTLGSLRSEFSNHTLRYSINATLDGVVVDKDLVNFVFGSSSVFRRKGLTVLMIRILLSVIIIFSGCYILNEEMSLSTSIFTTNTYAISQIILGGMLAIGFLTRFATFAGFAGFGYMTINAVNAGVFNSLSLVICLLCLAFIFLGAGKYSADFLIRKIILTYPHRRRSKIAEHRLSYRAYRYSPYR